MGLLLILSLCLSISQGTPEPGDHKPTDKEVAAIVLAVEDEIYDWGFEKGDYTNIGTTGAIGEPTEVPLFISRRIDGSGRGEVIYRLMPFGEVIRTVWILPDGTALLSGDPWDGFPASHPDTRTIYLNDDEICAFKQTAVRTNFTVDPDVSRARREQAIRRQIARVGHSQFRHVRGKNSRNPWRQLENACCR